MSYLTTELGGLQLEVIAALEGEGFPYDQDHMSWGQYLASALGEPNAWRFKSHAQMLSEIDAQYGGTLSHLRASVAQLLDDVAANIGAGGGGVPYVAQAVHFDGRTSLIGTLPSGGALVSATVSDGGQSWSVGDTFTISGGLFGAGEVDTITPASFSADITAVATAGSVPFVALDQGAKTFTLETYDYTSNFPVGVVFGVSSSTGNDGTYTVTNSVFDEANTVVTVAEAIPDPTVDGTMDIKSAITVAGDHVSSIPLGSSLGVTGSTGNDGFYVPNLVSLVGGDTRIYLAGDGLMDQTADGSIATRGALAALSITVNGSGYRTETGVAIIADAGPGSGATVDVVADAVTPVGAEILPNRFLVSAWIANTEDSFEASGNIDNIIGERGPDENLVFGSHGTGNTRFFASVNDADNEFQPETTDNFYLVGATWKHILFFTDSSANPRVAQFVVDGVPDAPISEAGAVLATSLGDVSIYGDAGDGTNRFYVGQAGDGAIFCEFDLADYQMWAWRNGDSVDLTDPALIAKFIDGDGKPANPALAVAEFGTPTFLLKGDASEFATNPLGVWDAFTVSVVNRGNAVAEPGPVDLLFPAASGTAVLYVFDRSQGGDVTDKFESVLSVDNQIQQLSAQDLDEEGFRAGNLLSVQLVGNLTDASTSPSD